MENENWSGRESVADSRVSSLYGEWLGSDGLKPALVLIIY